ncbi:MAG: UDP-N-acetylmuramoyl-tripeptide--D-alanyl-D-alanine ligase [Cyanobacteria bacterium]|nr:UDP-N-acetylmuramoyl-tripeptide--D-alanyl-D-alanine ligase [Cyanobacteriota bacterium]MDW8202667.1 UDP-N-acetylmuramoyl-tripeptide--D-alanyl-D-alanine ligase [Cyanobacteriota bacterium SKYGB_h_bin112]
MPFSIALGQLAHQLQVHPINQPEPELDTIATGITTDTRVLKPGDLFVALRGERFDGHDFLPVAHQQGAVAAIVDDRFVQATATSQFPKHLPLFVVTDTLQAYQTIAHWWRQQFTLPIVAVTGSVGKTTTKEMIAAVLATQGTVLKSQANFNNEIGVPKTLLELDQHYDYAVIEMGMRALGEIALLSQIACPNIAVITNVGTAHIGRLGSEAAIAQAKCELLQEMPQTGTAILNHDCPLLLTMASQVWSGHTITYGLTGGDLHGQYHPSNSIDGVGDRLTVGSLDISLPLPGRHNALNYLAALAVAKVLGIDWSTLAHGIRVDLPTGRSRRYVLPNDVILLDETYNAGLESMLAALHLLAQLPGQRHIAVLGTMKELGDHSAALHQQVGESAQALGLDGLLLMIDEPATTAIANGASKIPLVEQFQGTSPETCAALVQRLCDLVQPGDRILFKASNSVGMSRVVEAFRQQYLPQPESS